MVGIEPTMQRLAVSPARLTGLFKAALLALLRPPRPVPLTSGGLTTTYLLTVFFVGIRINKRILLKKPSVHNPERNDNTKRYYSSTSIVNNLEMLEYTCQYNTSDYRRDQEYKPDRYRSDEKSES
jgi:hypothetical protein